MEDRPNGAEPEALRVIAQGRGAQIQETIACPRHRGTLGAFARCTVPYDEKPMLFPFRHARSFLIIALLGTSTYLSAQFDSVFDNPITGVEDNLMEGLYLRTEASACVTGRAKIVRPDGSVGSSWVSVPQAMRPSSVTYSAWVKTWQPVPTGGRLRMTASAWL